MAEISLITIVVLSTFTFTGAQFSYTQEYYHQRHGSPVPLQPAGYIGYGRPGWAPQVPPRRQINSDRSQQQSFLNKPKDGPRHFSLPSMEKVSQTLGALNVLGRYFLKKTMATPSQHYQLEKEENSEDTSKDDDDENDLSSALTVNQNVVTHAPELTVRPEQDEQLGKALYTLGRTVLGQNVTDSLVPVVQTVNQIGKFLPPLVYRDGRIILGSSANSTSDGGSIRNVVCTTPDGGQGHCLDLSGCPSLLLDLKILRKSLCFKALFVPGVCCPSETNYNQGPSQAVITKRPSFVTTTTTTTTPRPRPTFPSLPIPTNEFRPEFGQSDAEECGQFEEPSFRIVGGAKSTPGSWPWMAAIFLHGPKGTEFWCGGTLISKKYILTAAHCTKDQKQKSFTPRQFSVRLGDYDLVKTDDLAEPAVFRVAEIIPHPDFSGMGFYNDVALLRLDHEVNYSRFIKPICLPQGRAATNSFVGTFATVIGWGTDKYGGRENNALQEVKLPVWSNAECDKTYFQPITDIFLCAGLPSGGKDACQGDSGGPLMLELETGKWTQIGIVSFGNRCAEPGYPGVYTRLTKFTSWIKDNAI